MHHLCCINAAGLVSSLGASSIPSIVQAALQSSQRQITIPPMLLHQAHSIDQQATQLLAQRGQGILAGLDGLQAYSAALRLVLTPDYSDSSHHSQWARAVDSATASNRTEVCYLIPNAQLYTCDSCMVTVLASACVCNSTCVLFDVCHDAAESAALQITASLFELPSCPVRCIFTFRVLCVRMHLPRALKDIHSFNAGPAGFAV